MKPVARTVFWIVVTLGALALVWAFRGAVVLLLLSIAVGAAMRPMIDVLVARGLSLRSAMAIIYVAVLGIVGTIAWVLAARLVHEVPHAFDRLVDEYAIVADTWPQAGGFRAFVAGLLPSPGDFEQAISQLATSSIAQRVLSSALVALDLAGRVLLVIVMSIYWTSSRDSFERLWLSLLSVERRRQARPVWIATRLAVGAHLRRELGLSLLAALGLSVAFYALGMEYWAIATVAVLVLRLIPLLGAIGAVLAVFAAAAPAGLVVAAIATVATAALLAGLRVVSPRWFRAEPLDPILSILVILALGGVLGVVGLIVAPLIAAAIEAAGAAIVNLQTERPEPTMADLHRRTARLERRFRWSSPPPHIASLLHRLQHLVERAER